MKMEWTGSQQEAIETRGRRVLVSAGAGSGKTRVLVERFLRLLEENPDWRVSDIVAVTFTEKAAREMVSRIRKEIRSRIDQTASVEERRRWRAHRNELDSARVGTIHSLCASILRAHPSEAGLDPAFEVIEETEAAALLDQAIEEALDQAVKDSEHSIEIFEYMSLHEVRSALRSLITQGERGRGAIAKLRGRDRKAIHAFWSAALERARAEAALALVKRESWVRDRETVREIRADNSGDKIEQCRAQVSALLRELEPAGLPITSAVAPDESARLIPTLLDISASIILRGGSKKNWPTEGGFLAVKDALAGLREAVRGEKLLALEMNEADQAAAEIMVYLVLLYDRASERFSALKRKRAGLDFNDLEEITHRLLAGHEDVRDRYAERGLLRALMVDEFQDTSPVQKKILWMIAPRSGELFIIGDAKQSIYRFRGADVTIFHGAREEVVSGGGREIGMNACFRTHARLVSFINHIFPGIFTRESHYDTVYEPMSAVREAAHETPSVELHLITQEKEAGSRLDSTGLREAEAAFIARRIREIIEGKEALVSDGAGARSAMFGDFALLFQASTSFEIYEQALAEAGVPYVTIAGRGFYDRQEITDIGNLLAFIVSPNDSLALAGVLRSPMFALSDETLLRLRLSERTLWRSLCDTEITHPASERDAIDFTRGALEALRSLAGRVSPAEMITSAVRKTGYLAALMMLPFGERRVANVEKFIDQTHELSHMTLSEMVQRVSELKFRQAREGEASIEEAGAVRLMTVHKSKGLEFPVVWIADACYGGGRDKSLLALHPGFGVTVNAKADRDEAGDEAMAPASFESIRRVEERMDRAEKKRLLYVAATRARDHLIISGAIGRGRIAGDHWLGRISGSLSMSEEDRPASFAYPSGEILIGWHDAEEVLKTAPEPSRAATDEGGSYDPLNSITRPGAISSESKGPDQFPLLRDLVRP